MNFPDPVHHLGADARVVVLTGAGISAESGIPTFRGPEGFWTHGSRVYQPMELATWSAFSAQPELVWPWYLYRRERCREANPNPAHLALRDLEDALGDRFVLVTQNVDGLHLRAGNSAKRTFEIHGNIDYARCAQDCHPSRWPVPELGPISKDACWRSDWADALQCSRCGGLARPHVLWFDECYDEERYRYESSVAAVLSADLLVVVGTTGTTSLPAQMGQLAHSRLIPIIDINPDENPFSRLAERGSGGWVQAAAATALPPLVEVLRAPR